MKRGLILFILLVFTFVQSCNRTQSSQFNWDPKPYKLIELNKQGITVLDGDTIVYRKEKIRFLGIDTPEKASGIFVDGASQEPWASEATDFAKNFIQNGKKIQLIRTENRDRYNRILAYIIVDGKNLNAELARAGHAYTYYTERFAEQGLYEYRKQVKDAGANVTPEFESPEKWRKKNIKK